MSDNWRRRWLGDGEGRGKKILTSGDKAEHGSQMDETRGDGGRRNEGREIKRPGQLKG